MKGDAMGLVEKITQYFGGEHAARLAATGEA
jgi:hypothetical protein